MSTVNELVNYKFEQSPVVKKLIDAFYRSELYSEIKDNKWIYICSLLSNADNIIHNLENNILDDQRYAIIFCRYIINHLLKGMDNICISIVDKIEFISFILSFDNVEIMVVDDYYGGGLSLDPIYNAELSIAKYKSLMPLDYGDDPKINIVSYSKYLYESQDIDIGDVKLSKELIDSKLYISSTYDFEFGYFNPLVSIFMDDHKVVRLRKEMDIVYIYSNLPFAIVERKISLQKYLGFFKINNSYDTLKSFFTKFIYGEFKIKYLKFVKINNKENYLSFDYYSNTDNEKILYIFEPYEEVKKYTKKLNDYYANLPKTDKNYNRKITPKEKVDFLHYILYFSKFIILDDNLPDNYNKFDYNNDFLKDKDLFSLKGIMSFYR